MLGSQALRPIPKNLLRRVCPVLCKCAEFSEYRPQFSLLFYLFASLPFVYFLCSAWTIQLLRARDVDVRTPEIAGSWPSSSATKSQLLLLIFTSRGHRVCCFSSYHSVAMWYRTVQLLMIVFSWTDHIMHGLSSFRCVFDFGQWGTFTVFNV